MGIIHSTEERKYKSKNNYVIFEKDESLEN